VWVATGGNFVGFKFALETIPPFFMMTARLLGAGVILLAVSRLCGPLGWPRRREIVAAVAAGTLLLVAGQGAIVWGLQQLPAGSSALFASSSPLFLAAFQYLFLRDRASSRTVVGILLGFGGLVMMSVLSSEGGAGHPGAIGFVIAGSASWALGSLVDNRTRESTNAMLTGALQALWGGCVMFHYVSPIVALLAGYWILAEPIGWGKALSAAVVLAGVACIVTVRERTTE
jgi:drug/metabolite transporter (DMT)-like permease